MTRLTRLPQPRYIGDGVYARHDGYQFILETSDGISVLNRIGIEPSTMDGLDRYRHYAQDFYRTGQHRAGPGCEECGRDISRPGPVGWSVDGEVYQVERGGTQHEVRLCGECAQGVTQERLDQILEKREGE